MRSNVISEIKSVLKNRDESEEEKIIVIDAYNEWITEKLIEREHERMMNIHNLDEYLSLRERNTNRFEELNKWLKSKHFHDFQVEVVKEIALEQLFKRYTLNDIEGLIKNHENPKRR